MYALLSVQSATKLRLLCSMVACTWACHGAFAEQLAEPAKDSAATNFAERLAALESEVAELRDPPRSLPLVDDAVEQATWLGQCSCRADGAKFPNARLTGVFQIDGGSYGQDDTNRATLGDIEDGLGFRRTRVAAAGDVAPRTSYILELDFAQSQARFVDVWMQFADTPLGNLRVGRFRQPFGMAEQTSVRELPLLERPTAFALAPFRQTGAMLFGTSESERATWAVSGYRFTSDNFGNVYSDTGGYGMASRLTILPIDHGDTRLVHLGFDYSYNNPGRGVVQFVSTNEFFAGQNPLLGPPGLAVLPIDAVPPFVNTGEIATDETNLFNAEAAVSFGRLLAQSEVRWAVVNETGGGTTNFPAAYLHVRYMLTGETIPYNRNGGVFTRVEPAESADLACGHWGAWEALAQVSYIDLNGDTVPGPGRRLTNTTIGLTWYLNRFVKFQSVYIHSDLDDPTLGSSDADTAGVRGQLDF